MSVNTSLLFCVVILKLDVICMYLKEVRMQQQRLFETWNTLAVGASPH